MPTVEFAIAQSDHDVRFDGEGASYPPPYTASDPTRTEDNPSKTLGGGIYYLSVSCMRWDTSSIPDGETVTSAVLRVRGFNIDDWNGRSVTLEWYDMGTPDSSDYTSTVGSDAHAGTAIASLSESADNDFALLALSNINKTGFTGLRMHVSGGAPTSGGGNHFRYASWDHATLDPPRLIVTYGAAPSLYVTRHPLRLGV